MGGPELAVCRRVGGLEGVPRQGIGNSPLNCFPLRRRLRRRCNSGWARQHVFRRVGGLKELFTALRSVRSLSRRVGGFNFLESTRQPWSNNMIRNFIKRLFQRHPAGAVVIGMGGPRHQLEEVYRDGELVKVTGNYVIPKLDWQEASKTQDTRAEPPRGSS